MNRPNFIMFVGLPCSGKSTMTQKTAEEYNANIHSSDAIREELTGDINNQDSNELVFQILHKRIKDDLRNGKSTIYDACNLSYKRRMAFLQELKNIPCEKICILMAAPYDQCLRRNAFRNRKVPEHVIKRMYKNFDPPWYYEGWNQIYVEYSPNSEESFGRAKDWIENVKYYNQDNSHHNLTLGEHCQKAVEYVTSYQFTYFESRSPSPTQLTYAAMLHDCGKPFCKTFKNTKGEVTKQAHYYSHEHTGSYDSLFYEIPGHQLRVAVLIRWHMQPYFWEKDNNEKLHNKYRKLWGEYLYNDIMKLHEADRAAH